MADSDFMARMKECVQMVGSGSKLSEITGISARSISKYVTGQVEPTRTYLINIANAAGVTTGWLANNEGPKLNSLRVSESAGNYSVKLNAELLQNIVAGVDEFRESAGADIAPDKYGILVSLLYEHHVESGKNEFDSGLLTRYLKLGL